MHHKTKAQVSVEFLGTILLFLSLSLITSAYFLLKYSDYSTKSITKNLDIFAKDLSSKINEACLSPGLLSKVIIPSTLLGRNYDITIQNKILEVNSSQYFGSGKLICDPEVIDLRPGLRTIENVNGVVYIK
ncbi:MAG: hypothetical protein QW735_03105 [archaeon]